MKTEVVKCDFESEFVTPERCFISETWNSSNDEMLSIARARVKPGVMTALHYLKGVTERYLITSGKGTVEAGDLPPTEVNIGDVVIIPAGIPQRITNTGETDLIFYCICTPRFSQDCYHNLEVTTQVG
ncbi:MAG: cupin domain-containing protein [Euryarchaeota archaeon]|nr:cupin domain-containing protein [Euryarchaeota archaeon]